MKTVINKKKITKIMFIKLFFYNIKKKNQSKEI